LYVLALRGATSATVLRNAKNRDDFRNRRARLARDCYTGTWLQEDWLHGNAVPVQQSRTGHITTPLDESAALTLRSDGLALRAIAHAGQFGCVDWPSSTTSARFRPASEAALTIAVDDFTGCAIAL
jgi:hypothetical protein